MALLWIEGYEGYGTATGTNVNSYMCRRYPTRDLSSSWYIYSGRYGGYCGQGNGNYYAGTPVLTTCDTIVYGCAFKYIVYDVNNTQYFVAFMDGTTMGVNCKYNAYSGEIDVYRGTTLLGSTVGANIHRSWVYIEVKVKCHDSAGTVEVKVNGVTRLALTDQDTKAGTHTYHDIVRIYLSYYHWLDDIYILDTTGTANNDFLGNQRVTGIFPNGDSAMLDWTPSTPGTHYTLVDETRDNDDTDYVDSSTSGQTDLWDYGVVSGLGAIVGMQVNTTIKRTDSTALSLLAPVKSGATQSDGSSQAATTSYDAKCRVLETDPDTSAAWTSSGINAVQCGVKVT